MEDLQVQEVVFHDFHHFVFHVFAFLPTFLHLPKMKYHRFLRDVPLLTSPPALRRTLGLLKTPYLMSISFSSRSYTSASFRNSEIRDSPNYFRPYATMTATNGTEEKPKMQYKNLGNSGLKVSKVIVGTMSYGSPDWQGWVLLEEQYATPRSIVVEPV